MIFSGWAPKSANEGETPDAEALWMIRLLRHSAGLRWEEETDGVRENIMAEELWLFAAFCFSFPSTRHPYLTRFPSP